MPAGTDLRERLAGGAPLLLDGALNTELSAAGYAFNTVDWLRANIDAPERIAAVHASYARGGAQLHIANTFSTGLHVLESFGLEPHFETLNRRGVELCRDAVDAAAPHPQWIAGSISTYARDHDRANLPRGARLESNVAGQAEILADAGCDLIALEMLFDVEHTVAMLNGAARTGLPVSLGFVCERAPGRAARLKPHRTQDGGDPGIPLGEALSSVLDGYRGASTLIVAVMHSEIVDTAPALTALRENWDGLMAAYPNSGRYRAPGGWDASDGATPGAFAEACDDFLACGATIVGGCCGVGPQHIAALGERLRRR